jgi:hypothetical protein
MDWLRWLPEPSCMRAMRPFTIGYDHFRYRIVEDRILGKLFGVAHKSLSALTGLMFRGPMRGWKAGRVLLEASRQSNWGLLLA